MHPLKQIDAANALTPEAVFRSRYDWLLQWALHFMQYDKNAAEDLLQETWLRLIRSWHKVEENIGNPEPILYYYLNHTCLTVRRRRQRDAMQNLSPIEFDDLHLSLREDAYPDVTELQNELRRVVAYLCFRKNSAKAASVLLLRFFHGYYPEEIMRVCLLSRHAVDVALDTARRDVKAHLAVKGRLHPVDRDELPGVEVRGATAPPELLANELRNTIFASRTGRCTPLPQLRALYERKQPVPSATLGHIVSCAECLEAVSRFFGEPPAGTRYLEDAIGFAPRNRKPPASPRAVAAGEVRRSFEEVEKKVRRVYEHRPRSLVLMANRRLLAIRDVNSVTSTLAVPVGCSEPVGMIEVLSEQGLPLINLPVADLPPAAPPVIEQIVAFSYGRTLEIAVRFTGAEANIEVCYRDPLFLEKEEPEAEDEPGYAPGDIGSILSGPQKPRWVLVLRQLAGGARKAPASRPKHMLTAAAVFSVLAVCCFVAYYRSAVGIKPALLLQRAGEAELAAHSPGRSGVAVQRLRIVSPNGTVVRTMHRDLQRKRRPKFGPPDETDKALESRLAAAGVDAGDPLSALNFNDWHRREGTVRDTVDRSGAGLLTLTTLPASDPQVAFESLTVRESDMHPVERRIAFKDYGTVEIAELSYEVLPWSAADPSWFEDSPSRPASFLRTPRPGPSLPRLAAHLDPAQLDEAELGVRIALNRLHLDTSGRIQISRQDDGIYVQGIVDSGEQKQQLQTQLHIVPNVKASITTLEEEMNKSLEGAAAVTGVKESTDIVPEPSSLQTYLGKKGTGTEDAVRSAQRIMDAAFTISQESAAIEYLYERFAGKASLTFTARIKLSELILQHKAALLAALQQQEEQLAVFHPVEEVPTRPYREASPAELKELARKNFALCVALTSAGSTPAPPAEQLVPELAGSLFELRITVLHISAAAVLSPRLTAKAF